MGSVIKKRRKRMSKKKHRKLLRKTRVQRRKLKQVTAEPGRRRTVERAPSRQSGELRNCRCDLR